MFEMLHLNGVSVNGQWLTISAGSAIIFAAVMLFNPLELVVFAFCYGLSMIRNLPLPKVIFNISETINVTYITFLVWHFLHKENGVLLSTGNILPIIVTIFVFVILDLLAVSIIISIASQTKLLIIWRESLDWVSVNFALVAFSGWILAAAYSKFYLYGLLGFIIPLLLMQYNMYLFVKDREKQVVQLQDFNELLKDNNQQLIITLSQVIDARENRLLGHSITVAKYATAIGEKLNLSEEQMYDLKRGSLLHDLGKLGISEAILQKPGKLMDEEYSLIKKHPQIGGKILENIKGMEKVATIVTQHHEQFSGKGYPNQLSEEGILIEARIIALCDALDTMLSTRPYKQGWSLEEVIAELVRCRGTHFDPRVVDAFLELKHELEDSFFSDPFKDSDDGLSLVSLLNGKQAP